MEIYVHAQAPSPEDFDRITYWLVAFDDWNDVAYGKLFRQRWLRRGKPMSKPLLLDLPNAAGTRVALWFGGHEQDSFARLTQGRKMYALLKDERPQRLGIFMPTAEAEHIEAIVEAVLAGDAVLPSMKHDQPSAGALLSLDIFASDLDCARAQAIHAGGHLARSLAMLPGNQLTPHLYRQRLESLANEHGWAMRFYDEEELQRLGAGAFLAVSQGGGDGAGIVHLRYQAPRAKAHIALVGKGICFDTGGHQLKSAKAMQDMHQDMQGSAVAVGSLLTLSLLQADIEIDCWLALAENRISATAYKPHDVITALNGRTIEIIHTDAEGRLVLADTLSLAARENPDLIIDYATLTGSCVTALGSRYSGIFTNHPAWHKVLIENGRDSGERVWPFPMDADYDEELDSNIADIKQCLLGSEADHILAARFLHAFVADLPWLHLDLSACYHEDGLAHVPSAVTGFGVRYTTWLLLDNLTRLLSLNDSDS
jgi:leucyl aminopeptidase